MPKGRGLHNKITCCADSFCPHLSGESFSIFSDSGYSKRMEFLHSLILPVPALNSADEWEERWSCSPEQLIEAVDRSVMIFCSTNWVQHFPVHCRTLFHDKCCGMVFTHCSLIYPSASYWSVFRKKFLSFLGVSLLPSSLPNSFPGLSLSVQTLNNLFTAVFSLSWNSTISPLHS